MYIYICICLYDISWKIGNMFGSGVLVRRGRGVVGAQGKMSGQLTYYSISTSYERTLSRRWTCQSLSSWTVGYCRFDLMIFLFGRQLFDSWALHGARRGLVWQFPSRLYDWKALAAEEWSYEKSSSESLEWIKCASEWEKCGGVWGFLREVKSGNSFKLKEVR